MGGWEFALATGLGALSTVSGMAQARQQDNVQRQAQAIQAQQAQADIAALERQRSEADTERRNKLERAMAAQRAAFAAGGISADGSADAVFGNLLAESERERDSFDAEIDRRIQGLQSGIQLNLLNRATRPNYLGAIASFGQDTLRNWHRYGDKS